MALVLRQAHVWDGESAHLREADVVCEDGLISAIEPPGQARVGADDIALDTAGASLLPGLIDAHVHLVWSGGTDPAAQVDYEGEQSTVLRAAEHARAHLRAGITTVRDLGSNWDVAISVARAVDRGALEGPTVLASGRTVIMTGGHDPFWGLPCDGPDLVVQGVRTQVAAGADVIKTAATGGVYGQAQGEDFGASELTYEELAALAGEAHRRGRRVAAHALGTDGIRNAVLAGIDTIEHGIFLTEDIVEAMSERGTVLCPTVAVYRRMAKGSAPAYAVRKATEVVQAHRESVAMALDAGVPVIAGTDAGAPGMPHPSLVDEIEILIDYGLTPLDALRAATSRAADALGLTGAGRVRVGGPADFALLDGDPFSDPSLLRSVWGVVRRQQVTRATRTSLRRNSTGSPDDDRF